MAGILPKPAGALSLRHHLINMGRNTAQIVIAPVYGTFIAGPKKVKEAYMYEVWGREKEEKRGLLRYKLFALWRAPGEEAKSIIDGLSESVTSAGTVIKELLSILFSD